MIPSLVADEVRSAIVEYLSTTFSLADDEARAALEAFLNDPTEGIFRGPYVRVRTPFRAADADWRAPLESMPAGFVPYVHQARAFERLSSLGREPQPTIVTTGTGSGKTEAFLYPILDHCRRARASGERGIKALLLYPMNALATDQARRLADLLHTEDALAGITAGIYIGGEGAGHTTCGPGHLIDDRHTMQVTPPDILLTNYKMLDLLLQRRADHELWISEPAGALRYLVLDEFHTYDGAQGTDVAMLLRRLGATLGVAQPGRPLGAVTPVATSATLGSSTDTGPALRDFAQRVFGLPFDEAAVIGEDRQSADEACGAIDYHLPIPEVAEVAAAIAASQGDELDALAALFTGERTPLDASALGEHLLRHPLTRAVLAAVGERSRSWHEALEAVVTRAPTWGAVLQHDPAAVDGALGGYLALLSIARRPGGAPLFSIEVQLWVREVSRLLRTVAAQPAFRWADSAPPELAPDEAEPPVELPAVYCRHCGRAGWMAVHAEVDNGLRFAANEAYLNSVQNPTRNRALIRATADEPGVRHLEPHRQVFAPAATATSVPVLVAPDDDAARTSSCPSCSQRDGIRFLGSRVASLASVCITQLFGSSRVHGEERKLLAFTDSVQDASHRAAFFAGRTYRFNLRTRLAQLVRDNDQLPLHDLGGEVLTSAGNDPAKVHALVPPDLNRHPTVRTLWTDSPDPAGRRILESRLSFEAQLELGVRSRIGRTLELTRTVAAEVNLAQPHELAGLVAEAHEHLAGTQALPGTVPGYEAYVRGLLERLRLRGAILHPWLEPYVHDDGNTWRIWGGRPDGMPAFPTGQSRPVFVTTAKPTADGKPLPFDSATALSSNRTWLVDWAVRCLGVEPAAARDLNLRALNLLAAEELLIAPKTSRQNTVFGLDPRAVIVSAIDDDLVEEAMVRCPVCVGRHTVVPERLAAWVGMPCLRYGCTGRYQQAPPEPSNYYRRLYRSGVMRRVVADEHTGLLQRRERETLEASFKAGTAPAAPNVLACTPTMELGIDIGDLSAVLLTSVPRSAASYLQRVGRAGRATGNAFVATVVPSDPRALYYLTDPAQMIAGEVRPPNCYLDAAEILRRQYFAYLLDRAAAGELDAPPIGGRIGDLMRTGLDAGGALRLLLDESLRQPAHVERFLALFGGDVSDSTAAALREYATAGIEVAAKTAVEAWNERQRELGNRRQRLKASIERAESAAHRTAEEEHDLRRLKGERAAAIKEIKDNRNENAQAALVRLGLLPNYQLLDDATELQATLWAPRDDGDVDIDRYTYQRPSQIAISEFAPGNVFYVQAHKLLIDALDIGSSSEPDYVRWRLCPECGFGAEEASRSTWTTCPRCHLPAIADAGASHRVLDLKRVYSSDSEERSRVYDESDQRDRLYFDVVQTVDVDPLDVVTAHQHRHVTFGMELAHRATIRTLNLGPSARPGERVAIAGREFSATRFRTCRHCGAVDGVRSGESTDRTHRGWCPVRSKSRGEAWDDPVLLHEIHTEAVRLLLPVSTFEVDERLASFKAALLLGLRLDFGGDPEHLQVIVADHPGSGGPGRRRFLVLHDTVPGGTGYLDRLADPARLGAILAKARDAIATCPCRDEGRPACHRCLLGYATRREIPLVSRSLALELLDELLAKWELSPVPTVAELGIGQVEESELERQFKAALTDWAAATEPGDPVRATVTRRARAGGREALELRLTLSATGDASPAQTLRWLIEEQRDLSTSPPTRPDFLISRQDGPGPEIAVYVDGFAFHAAPGDASRVADDARKRDAVRRSGRLVWALTWDDVTAFHEAVISPAQRVPPDRPLLTRNGRQVAQNVQHQLGAASGLEVGLADQNPMRLLLSLLSHPAPDQWEQLAASLGAGLAHEAARQPATARDLRAVLAAAVAGDELPPTGDGPYLACRWVTPAQLPLTALLDARPEVGGPNAQRWTVVTCLDDRPDARERPEHKGRWQAWLQWANVLQFLRTDREAAFVVRSQVDAGELDIDDFAVVPDGAHADEATAAAEARSDTGPDAVSPEAEAELDLILDPAAQQLARGAVQRGAPVPVAGHEPDDDAGWVLEVAWPAQRVAILTDAPDGLAAWLERNRWDARSVAAWDVDSLLASLTERG